MNTIVYVIRHGDVDIPVNSEGRKVLYGPDRPISLTGRSQMLRLGAYFRQQGIVFSGLYTSPTPRANFSAYLIKSDVGASCVTPIQGLRAICYPTWEGRPIAEFEAEGGDIFVDESMEEVDQRLREALRIIRADVPHNNDSEEDRIIGIVTHGEESGILLHMLRNPGDDIPGMDEHVPNGEAYRLVISPEGTLLEGAPIIPDEIHSGGVERR